MTGEYKMDDEYKDLQKEIDRILWETSEKNTGKTYQEMIKDEKFKSSIKKIGKLIMELEKIEEKAEKNKKQKIDT